MKLHLNFKPQDFETLRSFEKAVQRQVGNNVYVGTDSMCLYFEFPPALKAMLQPHPPQVPLEFELESSKPS